MFKDMELLPYVSETGQEEVKLITNNLLLLAIVLDKLGQIKSQIDSPKSTNLCCINPLFSSDCKMKDLIKEEKVKYIFSILEANDYSKLKSQILNFEKLDNEDSIFMYLNYLINHSCHDDNFSEYFKELIELLDKNQNSLILKKKCASLGIFQGFGENNNLPSFNYDIQETKKSKTDFLL